jgi:hypothetical protein
VGEGKSEHEADHLPPRNAEVGALPICPLHTYAMCCFGKGTLKLGYYYSISLER